MIANHGDAPALTKLVPEKPFRALSCQENLEARPGIEPGCKDLQSSASPLRHRASMRGRRACVRFFARRQQGSGP